MFSGLGVAADRPSHARSGLHTSSSDLALRDSLVAIDLDPVVHPMPWVRDGELVGEGLGNVVVLVDAAVLKANREQTPHGVVVVSVHALGDDGSHRIEASDSNGFAGFELGLPCLLRNLLVRVQSQ